MFVFTGKETCNMHNHWQVSHTHTHTWRERERKRVTERQTDQSVLMPVLMT